MCRITAAPKMLIPVAMLLALVFASSRVAAVEYHVRFDAAWSAATHPGAYPSGAHFSPLIGVTHNDQVTVWESGGIASPGIEQMAETGGTSTLQAEFEAAAGDTDAIILTSGLSSPGSTSTTFDIVPSHSFVTLVTMVAPSPDWFVGVTRLDLRNGSAWVPQLTVDLFAYDAGSDRGTDFRSPNADITPQIPIVMLEAPFADTPALGTFTFTLVGDYNNDGSIEAADYTVWRDHLGTPAGTLPNDVDGGVIGQAQYARWKANIGGAPTIAASLANTPVPEPSVARLLLLGAALVCLWDRRVSP